MGNHSHHFALKNETFNEKENLVDFYKQKQLFFFLQRSFLKYNYEWKPKFYYLEFEQFHLLKYCCKHLILSLN